MRSITVIYLMVLGMMIGIELAAGAFVAPVIFFPQTLLGEGILSHFQSGILMTEIFLRMNTLLLFVGLFSVLFEIIAWVSKANHKDRSALLLSLTAVVLAFLFIYYYTPFIQEAQAKGALQTATDAFRSMHKQSEWVMKALMMVQIGLFLRRGIVLGK